MAGIESTNQRVMRRKVFYILLLFLISAILRFWKLGQIPQGLSVEEINFGLSLSEFLGERVLNPFVIRLPFSIIGVASVFLFFLAVKKMRKDFWFAYIAALLLALLPWHIGQSRVYSIGLLVFGMTLLLVILFARKLHSSAGLVGKLGLGLAGVLFLFSIFSIPEELRITVDQQRSIASQAKLRIPARPFSNKLVESYRFREKLVFENLDIGNYFFRGHPRERWGVEEIQKLYLAVLPFFLLGFVKLGKKLGWLLLAWSSLAIVLSAFFEVRGPSLTLPLVFPIILLSTSGLKSWLNQKKVRGRQVLYFLAALFILEFLITSYNYFSGLQESLFSPRRPIYQELTLAVKSLRQPVESVLVSQRLDSPEPFFEFYTGKDSLENFEFRTFDIWKETDLDVLFIDVLPDEPSPSEPLYTENGNWPEELEVLEEFYDVAKRQKIVIYRL